MTLFGKVATLGPRRNGTCEQGSRTAPTILFGKIIKTGTTQEAENTDVRSQEHLTPGEVDKLLSTAGKLGRHGHRDKTLVLITYRHGLRVSELIALRWDQVDLDAGLVHINRMKNGVPSTHPLGGTEIRALRRLKRDYPATQYVFVTERKGPMTDSVVRKLIARAGRGLNSVFRPVPTCCAMPAGSNWRTMGMTSGLFSTTWGTRTSSIRCGTPSWRRIGLRIFGGIKGYSVAASDLVSAIHRLHSKGFLISHCQIGAFGQERTFWHSVLAKALTIPRK